MFLHNDGDMLSQAVRAASAEFNLNEDYVLKDYYAVMMLKEVTRRNESLIFKGGTCLSKCYNAIERFSEDVDLGIPFEHATEGMRKKIKVAVAESAAALGLIVPNIESTRSRREYNRYDIALPKSYDALILETAIMTPASPFTIRPLQSFIGQLADSRGQNDLVRTFGLEQFNVRANSLERTFADKVFAICDYYLLGHIPPRQSRHLYDLHKLISLIELDSGMHELMATVRRQRLGSHRCPSAEPHIHLSGVLRSIIDGDIYKADYKNVTIPLLYENVDYDIAARSVTTIASFLDEH